MVSFDESGWPLVVVRMAGKVCASEMRQLEQRTHALLDRHEPYGIVWDISGLELPAHALVMDTLRWTKDVRLRAREEFEFAPEPIPVFAAYVLSPRTRRLVEFFEQMSPRNDTPNKVFASVAEAAAACAAELAAAGVEVA